MVSYHKVLIGEWYDLTYIIKALLELEETMGEFFFFSNSQSGEGISIYGQTPRP